MVHERETEVMDGARNVLELRVDNLPDNFSSMGNDSGGTDSHPPSNNSIGESYKTNAKNTNVTNHSDCADRNAHDNGLDKRASLVTSVNNMGELNDKTAPLVTSVNNMGELNDKRASLVTRVNNMGELNDKSAPLVTRVNNMGELNDKSASLVTSVNNMGELNDKRAPLVTSVNNMGELNDKRASLVTSVNNMGELNDKRASLVTRVNNMGELNDKRAPLVTSVNNMGELNDKRALLVTSVHNMGELNDKTAPLVTSVNNMGELNDKRALLVTSVHNMGELNDKRAPLVTSVNNMGELNDKRAPLVTSVNNMGELNDKRASLVTSVNNMGELNDKRAPLVTSVNNMGELNDKRASLVTSVNNMGELNDKSASLVTRVNNMGELNDKSASLVTRVNNMGELNDKSAPLVTRVNNMGELNDKRAPLVTRVNNMGELNDKRAPLVTSVNNMGELNDKRASLVTSVNNMGELNDKRAPLVTSVNNMGELKRASSLIADTTTINVVNPSKSKRTHPPSQLEGNHGGLLRIFDRFRRQNKAATAEFHLTDETKAAAAEFHLTDETKAAAVFHLTDEKCDEIGRRPGSGVQVIRSEKMDPTLDANNNSCEGVACDGRVQENGGGRDVKRKKMSDSEDDTRPIIRASRDPEIPEVQSRNPNLITWWTWIAYSQGHVYNDLCASMWFTYLMPYLQKCVRLSPSNAGLLMLIGQVADALATPVVGLLSDRGSAAWYCALGRRKTWHILGTILITVTFPFIFSPILPFLRLISEKSHVLYYIPFICFFQFGWASAQIAHLSLVPDLTPNDNERTSLLSVRYAFTVISNLLVYVIMYIAVHTSSTPGPEHLGPQDSTKFQYISYIVMILGFLATLIFYAGVSESRNRQLQLDLRQASSAQMYEARKRTPRQLLGTTALYTVGVLYMTARMFFNILQMFIVFYVQDTLALSKANIAVVPLVILISGFVTSLRVKQANERLGRKISHLIGLILGVLVSVIVFVGTHHASVFKIYQVYAIAILYGMSSTVIQVTSFGMAADFVGDDVSNGAFIYGVLSFADKTSNGVVGYLIQKFNPEEGYYYRLALSYGCGIPCLIGILALIFLPPIPQVKPKPREANRPPVATGESPEDEPHSAAPR